MLTHIKNIDNSIIMDRTPKPAFAVALSYFLKKRGYGAQSAAARKLEISQPLINAIANGKSLGSEKNRRAIAAYFGLSMKLS